MSTAGSSFTSEADESSVDESGGEESIADQNELCRTTVMMRNIPSQYTRANLLDLFDQRGFNGLYDFVYLPVDFDTELNHGYAFINFVTTESVEKFRSHFIGFTDWSMPFDKACEIFWSEALQGIDQHIQRYRDSPVMHESVSDRFRPVLFKHGQRIPFPEPTKRIRVPRIRKPREALRNQAGRPVHALVPQTVN